MEYHPFTSIYIYGCVGSIKFSAVSDLSHFWMMDLAISCGLWELKCFKCFYNGSLM